MRMCVKDRGRRRKRENGEKETFKRNKKRERREFSDRGGGEKRRSREGGREIVGKCVCERERE
jgi:hypothetical protein